MYCGKSKVDSRETGIGTKGYFFGVIQLSFDALVN